MSKLFQSFTLAYRKALPYSHFLLVSMVSMITLLGEHLHWSFAWGVMAGAAFRQIVTHLHAPLPSLSKKRPIGFHMSLPKEDS